MSVQAMGWVFDHSEAELASRLVLLAIANHCDAEGRNSFPSQSSIATEAHVSERTVRRCVDALVGLGELTVTVHGGMVSGKGKTNYYELPLFIGSRDQQDNLSQADQPDSGTDQPDISAINRTPVADEPSLEPSTEPSVLTRGASVTTLVPTDGFAECWAAYPRKLNRKGAEKAWKARVRSGTSPADLLRATENYSAIRDGHDPSHTMHGSTFYGPDERWEDYLDPSPDATAGPRRESPTRAKSRKAYEALQEANRAELNA